MQHFRLFIASISLALMNLAATETRAQDFSYVYIQGDKQTPIYVKVEGEMLPRYGKNYALIGRLAPGPLHIDILFQQNVHPALHFTILVPENGRRAFLVHQKGDAFSLYDLQQNFYLQPDNDISDDHLPTQINNASLQAAVPVTPVVPVVVASPDPVTPATATAKTATEPVAKATLTPVTEPEQTGTATPLQTEPAKIVTEPAKQNTGVTTGTDAGAPVFIGGIELNRGDNNTGTAINRNNESSNDPNAAIINSDCTSPMSDARFVQLFASVKARKTEDERLGLFLQACKQYCFTTDMIAQLAQTMETDAARFSVTKNAYAKTTDQEKFPGLESLFATDDWKAEFRDLLHR